MIISYHPHASDQEDLKNRDLKGIFENMIDQSLMDWSIYLDVSLWGYRNTFKTSIRTTLCLLVYGKAFHLYVSLENMALWAVKLLNMDSSLVALERMYMVLALEVYRFHAYVTERLYKEKANDVNVVVKSIQCHFPRFDARHSVISDRGTHFQRIFKCVSQLSGTSNRVIFSYHPHVSDQEHLKNRDLKGIFKKIID